MKSLPDAEIYELEMKFMPWGSLMNWVTTEVISKAPPGGMILDLMCGPGYLLNSIHNHRPDLTLVGVDSDSRYISHGAERNSSVRYVKADIRTWKDDRKYDCVICMGGLHHLPYAKQPQLFIKMAALLKSEGFCICADPCIREYASELERQLAAAELGYEYLQAVLKKGAPPLIIGAAIDILHNDILGDGEYKNSPSRLIKMAKKAFNQVEVKKVWPEMSTSYGDYCLILSN